MARSIATIKKSITDEFMGNEYIIAAYGNKFKAGVAFELHFSKVSIENALFYIFAVAAYTLETLMDAFKADVETIIDNKTPHRAKWYRDKMLDFMYSNDPKKPIALIDGTDKFNTSSMTEADIAKAKIVKYAAVVESEDSSLITIKVAGGIGVDRQPLDFNNENLQGKNYVGEQYTALKAYIDQIKDAGVRYELINKAPNSFTCKIEVHYDAMQPKGTVDTLVREAIKNYLQNLPFNGEYSNMALVDIVQVLPSVKVVQLNEAKSDIYYPISTKIIPTSGYFKLENIDTSIDLNLVPYAVV